MPHLFDNDEFKRQNLTKIHPKDDFVSKISRRKFLASSAAVVGASLVGSAQLSERFPLLEEKAEQEGKVASAGAWDDSLAFSHWSYGGLGAVSPFEAKSVDFKYWFDPVIEKKPYSFREEVFNACKRLDARRAGKTIALCFSGGLDSEVIAVALDQLSIPYEIYFLDLFGQNKKIYHDWVKPFAKARSKEAHVVSLSEYYFVEDYSRVAFMDYGCELPTYLAMTYLFNNIPNNQFIVVGDGDLDRQGPLFEALGKKYLAPKNGWFLSYSNSSTVYHLWARKNQRPGAYYFFSSTPELVASVLTSPHFGITYPFGFTKSVIHHAFPKIKQRAKSTNWDTPQALAINAEIRRNLRLFFSPSSEGPPRARPPETNFWSDKIGAVVDVNGIFLPRA